MGWGAAATLGWSRSDPMTVQSCLPTRQVGRDNSARCGVPIHLPFELSIPLVRAALVPYMSIYGLFAAGPFIVRDRRNFVTLISALATATFIGGVGFLLLPSRAAFAPPADLGGWSGLFQLADDLSLDYNMVPSLHVGLRFAVSRRMRSVVLRRAAHFCGDGEERSRFPPC